MQPNLLRPGPGSGPSAPPRLLRLVVITALVGLAAPLFAIEPPPQPRDVPPLVGLATVTDTGTGGGDSEWRVRLTLPKLRWETTGEVVPEQGKWPGLRVEAEKTVMTLRLGGPSSLSPSRFVDLEGRELDRARVQARLTNDVPVWVSVSGRMPEPYHLQLSRPDALIVILGPRDAAPAPELLPAARQAPAKPRTALPGRR